MNIRRVLVANRGEIALRIIRACHEEGLEAVAVYSDADVGSPHVRAADAAVRIGPAPAAQSYLRIDAMLSAARNSGAQAIHPGYGFLSERAVFAEAVERAGLVFVGPSAAAIRAMGNKTEARARLQAAGVPLVPGGIAPITNPKEARLLAEQLGFPVMVKAAAGGGGKGMRVVARASELKAALESAASEALKAFGDAAVYLEKFLERPRHVEIQILADHLKTIHLGERECSIQRRHQKLLEEAPSVAVSPQLRRAMGQAAIDAASAVGYRGAGTCEFLLASDGSFYFLEMNTRIQVEHPVTELAYTLDLVREQLRIARGVGMSISEWPMHPRGHAMECRITSEDPSNGFLPATGRISFLRIPSGPGVRWDSGVEAGEEVSLYYDSLLGKLIVHAEDRAAAIRRMLRALDELVVVGIATNSGFFRRLLSDPEFAQGKVDIQFLNRRKDLLTPAPDPERELRLAIAVSLAEAERRATEKPAVGPDEPGGGDGWTQSGRIDALRD
ncbi:MAG TPA: acetyl-CoA carboxylase biotin carboxylase subunit [Gemmatimonadales bacterium]|nr:acetyl-CoA carboxylase biotin carboxylase subunit [Gemmatimonadales bacterium]